MALWDDLVAYYKGGSAYDSWGKYDVSLTDVEIADGIGPTFSSWDFATSGSSDKAVVLETDKIPADTGIATVSMWFKGLQTGNGSGFVATNNNTLIRIAANELGIRVGSATSSGYNINHLRGLSTWTHLAVTADGAGNYEYYINGSSVSSISGGAVWADDIKRIGNFTGSDDEFADYITEFAFWSRVLTSDEIEVIHSNGESGTRDLTRLIEPREQMPADKGSSAWINMSGNVLLWHLNDAGGGSEPDASGDGHTGTPASVSNASGIMMHSASYSTSSAGTIFENAANFNGSNSDIDAASATATALGINGNNPRTTMCWAKSDNWSNDDNLWAMGNNSTRQDWSLLARTNGFKLNTWGDDLTWDEMRDEEKDNWFHVAATYDGTTMRLYLNGTERATRTPGSALGTADNYPLRVGNDHGYNGNPWDGLIQEFAMFDEALTAADIRSIYNTQDIFASGAYGPSSGSVAVGAVIATVVHEGGSSVALDNVFATAVHEGGSSVALDNVFATAVHEGGSSVALDNVFATAVHTTSSYLTVPNITGSVGETGSFSSYGSYGIDYYRWSWNSVPGTGSESGIVSGSFAFPNYGVSTWVGDMTSNVALYHCEGGSFVSDSSGQNNDVTLTSVATGSPGYVGSDYWEFSAVGSVANVASTDLATANDFTIAFWLYNLDSDSSWRVGAWTSGDKYPIIVEQGSNRLGYYWGGFQDSGAELTASDGWHHLAVVGNASKNEISYWIDGVEEGLIANHPGDAGHVDSIGNKTGDNYRFAEGIDEFAYWTRALSDDEIQKIYFLQDPTIMAASDNFDPTLEFVPQISGTYSINLEVSTGVSITATASITDSDCTGTPGGSATINDCGFCVGGTTGRDATWGKYECWDGTLVCTGTSEGVPTGSCIDCDSVLSGTAYINDCGFCVGGATGRDATWGKYTCWDGSIICSASESPISTGSCPGGPDCYGVPGGSAYTNSCGTCVGGTTGRGEFWGMTTCWDGTLVCDPVDCPIISSSAENYMVDEDYSLRLMRNASSQRPRRVEQVPFMLGVNTTLSIREGSNSDFSGSY